MREALRLISSVVLATSCSGTAISVVSDAQAGSGSCQTDIVATPGDWTRTSDNPVTFEDIEFLKNGEVIGRAEWSEADGYSCVSDPPRGGYSSPHYCVSFKVGQTEKWKTIGIIMWTSAVGKDDWHVFCYHPSHVDDLSPSLLARTGGFCGYPASAELVMWADNSPACAAEWLFQHMEKHYGR